MDACLSCWASRSGWPEAGPTSISQSVADMFSLREQLTKFAAVAVLQGRFERRHRFLKRGKRLQDIAAVFQQNLRPQFGIARGDAGEIAPSAGHQRQVGCAGVARNGRSDYMWQMTGCG